MKSTKSTKIATHCGNCSHDAICYDTSCIIFDGKCRKLPRRPCPFLFFDWLNGLGDVVRIVHSISDFYESYTFFVGSHEVTRPLPHWITDEMLVEFFECPVVLLYGGGYNG